MTTLGWGLGQSIKNKKDTISYLQYQLYQEFLALLVDHQLQLAKRLKLEKIKQNSYIIYIVLSINKLNKTTNNLTKNFYNRIDKWQVRLTISFSYQRFQ